MTIDHYQIVSLTCPACREVQRRVIAYGRAPKCLRCRRFIPLVHAGPR